MSEFLGKSLAQGGTRDDLKRWICGYVCGEGVGLHASGQCGLLAGLADKEPEERFQSG